MSTTKAIISVFTSPTTRGNPAGVVISPEVLPWSERRDIAIALAQPATAFLSHGTIAWHGPSGAPMPLCGHATSAAVHYLIHTDPEASLTFESVYEATDGAERVTGRIEGVREGDGFGVDLPCARAPRVLDEDERREAVEAWCKASGVSGDKILDVVAVSAGYPGKGNDNLAIRLDPSVDLGRIAVDFDALKRMPYLGIWITSQWPTAEAEGHDTRGTQASAAIRSRAFFPRVGLDEDEVCGSAHTFLVPWWVSTEPQVFAKYKVEGGYRVPCVQLSPRGGEMQVFWDGKSRDDGGRCVLFGQGVIEQVLRE